MQLEHHTAADFAQAMRDLLPPGDAWRWPAGGLGAALTDMPAQELARVDAQAQQILDATVSTHTPVVSLWRLQDYKDVARAVDPTVSTRYVRPFVAGSAVGGRLWSARARYVLMVRYDAAAGTLPALRAALARFKQAHVAIFYEAAQGGGYAVELSDA